MHIFRFRAWKKPREGIPWASLRSAGTWVGTSVSAICERLGHVLRTVIHAVNVRSHAVQLAVELLVPAIEMIDAADDQFTSAANAASSNAALARKSEAITPAPLSCFTPLMIPLAPSAG